MDEFTNYIRNAIDQTLNATDNPESRLDGLKQVLDSIPTDNEALTTLLSSFEDIASHSYISYKHVLLSWISDTFPKFSLVSLHPVYTSFIDIVQRSLHDSNLITQKHAIACFSKMFPFIFKKCAEDNDNNEKDAEICWQQVTAMNNYVLDLKSSKNIGVEITFIKHLLTLASVYSQEQDDDPNDILSGISLRLYKGNKSYMNVKDMEALGEKSFEDLLEYFKVDKVVDFAVRTAAVNLSSIIVKNCRSRMEAIVRALLDSHEKAKSSLSSFQFKSYERTVKVALIGLLKFPDVEAFAKEVIDLIKSIGTKVDLLKLENKFPHLLCYLKDPAPDKGLKRPSTDSLDSSVKKSKLDDATSLIHQTQEVVSKLSPGMAIELAIGLLQNISAPDLSRAVLQARSNPAVFKSMFSTKPKTIDRQRDPRLQGINASLDPINEGKLDITWLEDQDDDDIIAPVDDKEMMEMPMIEETKQEPVTEVVVPILKLGPLVEKEYSPPPVLSHESREAIVHSILARVFQFESNIRDSNGKDSIMGGMKASWMVMLARLVTRGLQHLPLFEVDGETPLPIKEENREASVSTQDQDSPQSENLENTQSSIDVDQNLNNQLPIEIHSEWKTELFDFITNDFHARQELAIIWLYEEWYLDKKLKSMMSAHNSQYMFWLHRIMEALPSKLDPRDRAFTKFLLDIPEVTETALDIVNHQYCSDKSRMALGITTLRDLINLRPTVRDKSLDTLLAFCVHSDKQTRSTAIITAKKWVPDNTYITKKVETFAFESISKLKDYNGEFSAESEPPSTQDKEENEEMTDAVTDASQEQTPSLQPSNTVEGEPPKEEDVYVIRHLELFFALTSRKHELLFKLCEIYIQSTELVQRTIRQQIYPLIKSIGMISPKLLHLIKQFPEGGETLVLRILVILTDKVRPSTALVSAVKSVYVERNLDARFLITIISGLEKSEIIKYLPRVVGLLNGTEKQRKIVKEVFLRLIDTPSVSNTTDNLDTSSAVTSTTVTKALISPPLSPVELMLAIHNMEESVGLKKAIEATQICFALPHVFKQEILAVILQQLIDQPKLPALVMRTIIQSVMLCKSLVKFVNSLLTRLISKRLWKTPSLWEGFIRLIKITQPNSFFVLLLLPRVQLHNLLASTPSLQAPLLSWIEDQQSKLAVQKWTQSQQSSVQYILSILKPKKSSTVEANASDPTTQTTHPSSPPPPSCSPSVSTTSHPMDQILQPQADI